MTFRIGLLTGMIGTALAGAMGLAVWWLVTAQGPEAKSVKPTPPARVAKLVKEDELNTVMLTPKAEERLGVELAVIERKAVRRVRVYGGEVIVPVGHAILVSAPLGGMLKAAGSGMPRPGTSIKKGQPIFLLLPLLTPEARTTLAAARVDADGQVKSARTQLAAAQVALERAQRLLRDEAGSKRNVDESQAQYDLALKSLETAEARRDLLTQAVGEVAKGTAAAITIESPQDGLLRNVAALPDQNVPSGAPLFEVVALERVWVRVPVYVGDLAEIVESEDATVGSLTAKPGEPTRPARPVAAPPSANPQAATVDLYYDVENRIGSLLPGQRVGVSLPLRDQAESVTAPWSAVVHDIYGGTWVYEQTASRTYVRRRVAVRHVVGDRAVLVDGPPPGTRIVAAGAQELFGAETGFSK